MDYKFCKHKIERRLFGPRTYTLLCSNDNKNWDVVYASIDKEIYNETLDSLGVMRI